MPKLAPEIEKALTTARRRALIEHVRATPELTLAQLCALRGELGRLAGTLTVAELTGTAGRRAGPTPRAQKPPRRTSTRDTRTRSGRTALDAKILDLLAAAKAPMGAQAIRAAAGGSAAQVRTSLHRLVKARTVKRTGRTRATRYEPR